MRLIKTDLNYNLLPIDEFSFCLLDGVSKEKILTLYPGRVNGAYYLDKFNNYLKDIHSCNLKDYIKLYLKEYPKCQETFEDVNFKITGKGLIFSNFKKGRGVNKKNNQKFKEFCDKMSHDRKGEKNPMFGKTPWNKGNEEFSQKMKEFRTGRKASEETKKKASDSAKKRKIHGHTGKKHSNETKQKLRIATALRYKSGAFKRETSIHIKVRDYLNTLNLKNSFQEEFHLKYYSIDFAFPEQKIAIECQGTFFHVDPRQYPNGPETKIQKRNFGRDAAKKKFLDKYGWHLIELWETEINNDKFKKILLCKLRQLNLINLWD